METQSIDSKATCEAIRNSNYGSVAEFCRQADVDTPFFYLILSGQRGQGKKGPAPVKTQRVVERLESEGLLVRRQVVNG